MYFYYGNATIALDGMRLPSVRFTKCKHAISRGVDRVICSMRRRACAIKVATLKLEARPGCQASA